MRQHRLLFLVLAAVFALGHPLAAQAPPVVEDFRPLVQLTVQVSDPGIDDVFRTEITIYRGGVLRSSLEVAALRDCCDRATFVLGKGTRAQVEAVEQALTAARIGQISGGCHLTTPNTGLEGFDQIRWTGPFGDRTNLVSFSQGALPPNLPAPPPCPAELVEARAAILAFAGAVRARPETKVFQGAAAFPSR